MLPLRCAPLRLGCATHAHRCGAEWALMCCVGSNFLPSPEAGSAPRFFASDASGRFYMTCLCVLFVILAVFANPALKPIAIADLVFSVPIRRPKAELLAQRLREVCIRARECRLQQTRIAASV